MKYGILENNKFLFIDDDKEKLLNTLPFIGKSESDIQEFEDEEVELAYDNSWYVKGYTPQKPQEEVNAERIEELKAKLSETDYIVIKIAEGEATQEEYAEVLTNRKAWRSEINELLNIIKY